ncbi:uncharacterized protein LOC122507586 [Leptopilina heterotoma]|uniref:uncharacterized protein LOC122507586 n=1 Tax=Leptopilina heterotoma TaxID=63436 RepID=UPI001CA82E78|nr:uncharacterized protein LOC122507586 [Leptopilina heterotoma]
MSFIGGRTIPNFDEGEDSDFSYEWSSSDESGGAMDIVKRGWEICGLIPGDKFVTTRGYLLTKLFEVKTEWSSMSYTAKVKRYFAAKNWLLQRESERGLLQSLSEFPPYEGFSPANDGLRLSYIQTFKSAGGEYRQAGSWQLTLNVDLKEVWETIGSEGHLFRGYRDESSEEDYDAGGEGGAVQEATVAESEEDWF